MEKETQEMTFMIEVLFRPLPLNDSFLLFVYTLRGDKVRMLRYAYPEKSLIKIKVAVCNHRFDSSFMCSLVICNCSNKEHDDIHDTECPYGDQAALNNI